MDNFIAFIPVRGGSKSIPFKNIKEFCGKPLVYWSIKAANDCPLIEAVYVSTDNRIIKDTVIQMGFPKVIIIDRDLKTATDTASTESAMLDFAKHYSFRNIVLIQATSPLIRSEDIEGGIRNLIERKADSLLSVVSQRRFIWEEEQCFAKPVNYDPRKRPLRQQWEGYAVENGAFYITSKEALLQSECRISGKIALYKMGEDSYFEIDEDSDWIIAENLKRLQLNRRTVNFPGKSVNLLICDVDGVLTDSGMYYSSNGMELKKFNTRDGKGIELVKDAGIKVMFLTSEDTDIVRDRARKLGIDFLFLGEKNKIGKLESFFEENKEFSFNQSIYIGDDINDIDCIRLCGFSAVPQDVHECLKPFADYICSVKGGEGCVREICDLLIERRKNE
jgi:N-acylneuraminate cytidylyltransferase